MSTKAISAICRRAGKLVVKVAKKWYSSRLQDVRAGVKERLPHDFATAVSSKVWADDEDPVLAFFWPELNGNGEKASSTTLSWGCPRCTFINGGPSTVCEMCGAGRD